MRGADLLGTADDDRASAAMFYVSAAKVGIRVIDVDSIDANIAKVLRQSAMRGGASPCRKRFARRSGRAADCRG